MKDINGLLLKYNNISDGYSKFASKKRGNAKILFK